MSHQRNSRGGWADHEDLPKGPNGRALCRRCSQEVPVGRRTFCSKACVTEWRIRTDAGFARRQVFQRDRGVCAECGKNVFEDAEWRNGSKRTPRARGSGDLWQADHIVPVAEGGGECGLDGLRTLCHACHLVATAALRKRLSSLRADKNVVESSHVE
jgi:5-methylcytosine-specific restriction enzyme A